MLHNKKLLHHLCLIVALFNILSCKKFTEIDVPRTDIIRSTVFTNDETANSAAIDMYYQLSLGTSFSSGAEFSISYLSGLSSDEARNLFTTNPEVEQFNSNSLLSNSNTILSLWADFYKSIYRANAIIEGLETSNISESLRNQMRGEALFFRAFCNFYLTNLWGAIPIVTSTSYELNRNMTRSSVVEVYNQIIADLQKSVQILPEGFSFSNEDRVRINKGAAIAFLARVYLYTGDYTNAEIQSSALIDNTVLYQLGSLSETFLKNSKETIFQLAPQGGNVFASFQILSELLPSFLSSFETGDQRLALWVNGVNTAKYKSFDNNYSEAYSVLRLAEQYLIRAEARAELGRLTGDNSAESDINKIRERAGLDPITATSKEDMMLKIQQERRVELFSEWGHRWLDIKRWRIADGILSVLKGSNWQSTDTLYPIPDFQILNSPVTQNDGY